MSGRLRRARAGLLHRDIKAHNVMLGHDGRVVLMDFGTGRELTDGAASDLAGTPLYVAPEVLDGKPATAQSDVYSLGVLLVPSPHRSVPGTGADDRRDSRGACRTVDIASCARCAPTCRRVSQRQSSERSNTIRPNGMPAPAAFARCALGSGRSCGDAGRFLYSGIAAAAVLLVATALWERQSNAPPATPPTIAVLPFNEHQHRT